MTGEQVPPGRVDLDVHLDRLAVLGTGSTDACVNGWNGIVISPSSYTVRDGSSARSEIVHQPALI